MGQNVNIQDDAVFSWTKASQVRVLGAVCGFKL